MDNITHTLTGLMMSRAGLNRLAPRATPLLMLAANIPDIDVLSWLWGTANYLHYHRWYTHALLLIPAMAVLPVLIMRLFTRGAFDWKRQYLVSFIGTASHPLLDFTNPYGIRILAPFSQAWPGLDLVTVIDIWIWLALFLALAAPALSRLVSTEIGARPTSGRGWAFFALCFMLVYYCGRALAREQALALQNAHVYQGVAPRRVGVMPDPFNPLRWHGVVETTEFFVLNDIRLNLEFDPTAGQLIYKPAWHPAMEAARSTLAFQDMMGFAESLLWRAVPDSSSDGATRVEAIDLRFQFRAVAIVDAANRVQETWVNF